MGQRDGSRVKSTRCSSSGPESSIPSNDRRTIEDSHTQNKYILKKIKKGSRAVGFFFFFYLLTLITLFTVQSLSPSWSPLIQFLLPFLLPFVSQIMAPLPTNTPHPASPPHSLWALRSLKGQPHLLSRRLDQAGNPLLDMSALVSRGLATPSSASCLHAHVPWGDCFQRVFSNCGAVWLVPKSCPNPKDLPQSELVLLGLRMYGLNQKALHEERISCS